MSTRSRPDSGFLLIGVVMFVLALTILGMSLYSLSGYEADFQTRSHDEVAALYSGEGGMDMVLELLQVRWNLDDAQLAVGHENVDSVYVSQPKLGGGVLTSGPMNDSVTTIIVVTRHKADSRKLVALYRPTQRVSPYTRLMTVSGPPGSVTVGLGGGTRNGTFVVTNSDSSEWTNDSPPAPPGWASLLGWNAPATYRLGGAPLPDVASFMAAHPVASNITPPYSNHTVTLDQKATGNLLDYYQSPPSDSLNEFTLAERTVNALTLNVSGTAIWILPAGLFSNGETRINNIGTGHATLVIVASYISPPSKRDADVGIYFFGGLQVDPTVNVILVTDGAVDLEQFSASGTHFEATSLSMYCNRLFLMGPSSGTYSFLAYDPAMTSTISGLEQADALPRGVGTAASSFAFLKGSWRDITP